MKTASIWSRLADVAGLAATPLTPSHYVGLLRPLSASHQLKARVEGVCEEAPGVATLTLRPGRGWRGHLPGQFVRVGVEIDGRIATRTYSISSAPGRTDGCVTITVKAQGRVSNVLVRDTAPGTYLTLGPAEGDFVLPANTGPLLFVTGGSGITPIASMLRTYAAHGAMPDIAHVHYARTAEDVIFGDELRQLAAAHPSYRLHVILTSQNARRFDREGLAARVPDWKMRETFACGPQSLLDACAFTHALHVERFTAALAPAPENATGGRVRFRTSRVSAIADGRTPLLRIAEDAGVSAPHGCRMGICHSCDVTLTAGCVRDLRTGERIDEPGSRIQTCVCAAAGDVDLAL
ncbi:MAG TPA: ferredoxin reductase [Kofleriaceae bacterium]|nr:ferredoxin reductase [Kofleriaceae bacterium]